jgi:hypothetical protein
LVASLERTAYPRFKRIISERELAQFFAPHEAAIAWAAKRTHGRLESLLTLLELLKSCARLGYFPSLDEVPVVVIAVRAAGRAVGGPRVPCGGADGEALPLLDPGAWGDGSVAAVDGTMMDAAVDNLLAETSIRYGGYGGIARHLVADTYVAPFSRFVPCGVWEAVYLIDSLLQNQSEAQPEQVHADTPMRAGSEVERCGPY